MSQLGSYINNLGRRLATGLNQTQLGGGGGSVIVRGVLITSDGDYFEDADGNHIAYAQLRQTESGVLLASDGDNLSDDAGNHISYLSI